VELTLRQTEFVRFVARGYKNDEIGTKMGIGGKTVNNYLKVIFDKTGMNTRLELTLWHLYHQTRGLAVPPIATAS
jgi:DNA-binding NarL/FixJ family response regulator